ncbi:5'-cGMP phosphodiesterase A (Cyclic GMP-binding protein A) (Phosphodiesterase 5) (DdPDE5) (Phosphodiesterase D) [Durusdinium trenchii]|uniref:5'-cGMP phosphodiesterase A (Cyclic GMP-binding protein A) (Phosphodiesterase 5) (DdPDE5) (Phosphodiesterase D) n=1 Tax=Durusdinium trenchii TaxID=1381693 RepID=A0ABP0J915_9DINO
MGAAGSVDGGNPSVDGGAKLVINREIEAESNRVRGLDTTSLSNSSVGSNVKTNKPCSPKAVDEDDEDDDRRSVGTSYTRLSTQHHHGDGIHAAIITSHPCSEMLNQAVVSLPRGGAYVRTKAGAIQFGIPPDTIKDSMTLGLTVPSIFVVPQERFNLELGINVAEIEFPAYFNFFILQKDVQLLVTPDQEKDLRTAFEETLEGPEDKYLYQDTEYGKFRNEKAFKARPDLRKEIDYFKEPRNGRVISCDTLLRFTRFAEDGRADLSHLKEGTENNGTYSLLVVDEKASERYVVVEDGIEIATVSYRLATSVPTLSALEKKFKDVVILEREMELQLEQDMTDLDTEIPSNGATASASGVPSDEEEEEKASEGEDGEPGGCTTETSNSSSNNNNALKHSSMKTTSTVNTTSAASKASGTSKIVDDDTYILMSQGTFTPPDFGVTMLGNSHGFDKTGTTTGFIVWIHGYGIAVDPPPHCDAYLQMNGVSPRLVTSVILTHCHADHDAGTFQKILKERRTTLITTRTIYEHFIRKYSAVSGLEADFLERLLDFHEVRIAQPTFLFGGVFEFFYALHALPCIGFKAQCANKTMSYSADTFNDPDGLDALEERGIISPERKQSLLDFPWRCDLVLHECGVPPIHTPPSTLQNLPDEVKENLYAVHIANDAAEKAGLRKALAGFDNTLVLIQNGDEKNNALQTLQLCAQTDVFRDADIKQCIHVLQMATRVRYSVGNEFVGSVGGVFFIVAHGVLKLERPGRDPIILKLGDYFGEISAMNGETEDMKITAITDVEIVGINKYAFNQFLESCPEAHKRLLALESMRSQGFSGSMKANSVFSHLSFPQKTQLQSLTSKPREIKKGEKLVTFSCIGNRVFIVSSGAFSVRFTSAETNLCSVETLKKGGVFIPRKIYRSAVLCDLLEGSEVDQDAEFIARTDSVVFEIFEEGFKDFLLRNPGIQLALMKHRKGFFC